MRRLLVLAIVLVSPPAFAEAEISVFGGYHTFSPNLALGRPVPSTPANALANGLTLGARVGYLATPHFGGELEVAVTPTSTNDGTGANVPSLRVQGVYNILTGRVRPSLLLGGAGFAFSPSDPLAYGSDVRPAVFAGGTVHVDIGDWWGVRGDGRVFGMEATAGNTFAFDREVSVAIYGRFPAPPPPEERGRGPKIEDKDHDGVGDNLDKCPDEPGPVRNYGCPVAEDRDKDGIADGKDQCPDLPGPAATNGCPDTDGDGVVDPKDACPKERGIAENKGCPDRDRDGDGVVDRLDKCPDKAGPATNGGCPEPPPPPPAKPPIPNLDKIDFDVGKSTMPARTLRVLDEAARIITAHPEIMSVEIVGHTDDTGAPAANLALSQARADAVRAYLVQKGIAAGRLTAVGRGSEEPIDTGTTEAARKRNRRVEFRMKVE